MGYTYRKDIRFRIDVICKHLITLGCLTATIYLLNKPEDFFLLMVTLFFVFLSIIAFIVKVNKKVNASVIRYFFKK